MRGIALLGGLLWAFGAVPVQAETVCLEYNSDKTSCLRKGDSSELPADETPPEKLPPDLAVLCKKDPANAACQGSGGKPPAGPGGTKPPLGGTAGGTAGGVGGDPGGGAGFGGGGGGFGGGGGGGGTGADAAAVQSLGSSVLGTGGGSAAHAVDSASRVGAAMQSSMANADAGNIGGAGGGGGGGGRSGGSGGGGGRGGPTAAAAAGRDAIQRGSDGRALPQGPPPGANFATPSSNQDLALAAMSGFGGTFASMGLKMGRGPDGGAAVLHQDGSAASSGEIAKLSQNIAKEPMALMQRPDFFNVLSRDKFDTLKQDYLSKPALAQEEFKHIEMSASQRDFQHSQSCDRLSGGCNKYSREMSYRKGEYVPPEDLNAIWDKIKSEAAGEAAAKPGQVAPGTAAKLGGSALGGIGAKLAASMKSLFGGLFGDAGPPNVAGKAIPSSSGDGSQHGGEAGWGSGGARKPLDLTAPRRNTLLVFSPPVAGGPSPAPPAPDSLARRFLIAFFAAAAAGGFVFLVFLFKRRREEPAPAAGLASESDPAEKTQK